LFNGNLVVGLVVPLEVQARGVDPVDWPSLAYGGQTLLEKLPILTRIPIVDGVARQTEKVFYNADIDPPNSRYVAWLYDRNMVQLTEPTINDTFAVSADTFTPTVAAPVIPTLGTTLPTVD
jgi:hypothetical protein